MFQYEDGDQLYEDECDACNGTGIIEPKIPDFRPNDNVEDIKQFVAQKKENEQKRKELEKKRKIINSSEGSE